MTLQEAKDQVAKKYECSDFQMLLINLRQPDIRKTEHQILNEVIELYVQSERARIWDEGFWACESSIGKVINPSNPYKS